MISVNITWKFTADSQYLFVILRKKQYMFIDKKN